MPERLKSEVLDKVRYINTLTFNLPYLSWLVSKKTNTSSVPVY